MNNWKDIIEINTNSSNFIAQITDKYSDQKFDPLFIQFYTLNIFRRLVFIQKGINPHLQNIEFSPQLELPIGILLRAVCFDVLQYGYIIKYLDEVNISETPNPEVIPDYSRFTNELRKIFSENIINQEKDYKALSEVNMINEEEFVLLRNEYINKFNWLIPENKHKFEKSKSIRDIFRCLKLNSKYDNFSNVFIDYSYYSKLEHFGILSWAYTTPQQNNFRMDLHRIKRVLMTIIFVYKFGLVYLQRTEDEINKMEGYLNEIYKINLGFIDNTEKQY